MGHQPLAAGGDQRAIKMGFQAIGVDHQPRPAGAEAQQGDRQPAFSAVTLDQLGPGPAPGQQRRQGPGGHAQRQAPAAEATAEPGQRLERLRPVAVQPMAALAQAFAVAQHHIARALAEFERAVAEGKEAQARSVANGTTPERCGSGRMGRRRQANQSRRSSACRRSADAVTPPSRGPSPGAQGSLTTQGGDPCEARAAVCRHLAAEQAKQLGSEASGSAANVDRDKCRAEQVTIDLLRC